MDSKTNRRRNLAALERAAGSLANLEKQTGVAASYLSQIKGGRGMGDDVARRIEHALAKPLGWMDLPHEALPAEVGSSHVSEVVTRVGVSHMTASPVPTYSVLVLETGGSMGLGRSQPEYDTIVGKLDVNQNWVRTNLPQITSPNNLRVITGYGDSMEGTYEDGDILLVDIGVKDVRLDAVFSLNAELYIKRLQRRPAGGITIISDNKKYEPHVLGEDARETVQVLGRVVWAWNGRKL